MSITKKCSISECDNKLYAKTWCQTHYWRDRTHGSPLITLNHGMYMKPIWNSYRAMKSRCYSKKSISYSNYGGRGIKVCDRWLGKYGFLNFMKDMGEKPTGDYSLDRINVNGDYSPSNCKWSTRKEQNSNQRRHLKSV